MAKKTKRKTAKRKTSRRGMWLKKCARKWRGKSRAFRKRTRWTTFMKRNC